MTKQQRKQTPQQQKMEPEPWTAAEKKEIQKLTKAGKTDSEIRGWMKIGNNRKGTCPPIRSKKMATKKKTSKKKAAAKTPGRKPAGKRGRTKGTFLGTTVTAIKGQEKSFYKGFPRFEAYELLCKKGSMKTSAFVDAVEKFKKVTSRAQALGILTKLIDKGCAKTSGEKKAT